MSGAQRLYGARTAEHNEAGVLEKALQRSAQRSVSVV
jgi:hypothetical protein